MAERVSQNREGRSRRPLTQPGMSKNRGTERRDPDREVTRKLNDVLADETSSIDPALRKAQARSIRASDLPRAKGDYGSRCTSASAIPRSPATAYRK